MTRPLVHHAPQLVDVVNPDFTQISVEKIDLLFMIDNSASMGDKQEYLKQAIPDLIGRLVSPHCVDDNDTFVALSTLDSSGRPTCAKGELEFPPVHDMHVAIVSSSLGAHGGDQCTDATDPHTGRDPHNNDRGRLLNRAGADEHAITAAQPSSFLDWRPDVQANAGKPPTVGATSILKIDDLNTDFQDMVAGVGESGCGLEAQLESWYRFLIQPDPYSEIKPGGVLDGFDTVLLKQRHDFLRPDSLVAIIDVTDENDSEVDVRAYAGYGAHFYESAHWIPARANAACAADPLDPNCHSCDEDGHAGDPGCTPARYAPFGDPRTKTDLESLDNVNLRHVHMRKRYGIDPQFPLSRYVTGLTQLTVPDRNGEYPPGAKLYVGKQNCTNPLFAAALPDGSDTSPEALCNLPKNDPSKGDRLPNLVFYAHIGGVPFQLLVDPSTQQPKEALAEADWQRILGHDPDKYDFGGIDPHMIESLIPRAGLPAPSSADGADPVHGREWDTSNDSAGSDLQYACTFQLPQAKDCTKTANGLGCDCPTAPTTLGRDKLPPLCDPATPTLQIKAKTYPTIRELALVKKMGAQGVAASLCPIHTADNATKSDPLYGYRPAVASIVNAIKRQLVNQCIPHKVVPNEQHEVSCLVLEVEPTAGPQSACDVIPGRSQPAEDVLRHFRADQKANAVPGQPDPTTFPVCLVAQLPNPEGETCRHARDAGWCYVSGAAAGKCDQAIIFSPAGTPQSNARVALQCLEQVPAPPDDTK